MDNNIKIRLLEKLKSFENNQISQFDVVLLPDFFIDHFLTIKNYKTIFQEIEKIYNQGGGNLPNISQKIIQGGNSTNTALALSALGISSHLICNTSELGLHLLKFFLRNDNIDLSRVKTNGKLAITTALELGEKNTNIMIGDTGSVSDFSFDDLNENDLDLISKSDLLCVTTWNLNKDGTNLAKNCFAYAKKHNLKTYFDTGDPSPKKDEIQTLISELLSDENIDILGLNENELRYFSNISFNNNEELTNALKTLKEKIPARLDLHTSKITCSMDNQCIIVPVPQINEKYRSTGAGDTWNAGNIFGELLGLNNDERLLFANCVACSYISSKKPLHPNLDDVIKFIKNLRNI